MTSNNIRISTLSLVGVALMALGMTGCLSDDSDKDSDAAAGTGAKSSGGSSSGGSGGAAAGTSSGGSATAGTGSPPAGTACASPVKLTSSQAAIADFEDYDGAADLSMWSFPLGGDSATGILSGTFGYGDNGDNKPEAFEMVEGSDSMYALSISDSDSADYGGGLGLWMSECLDASAFTGISFWVRGKAPEKGKAKLSVLMQETQPSAPATVDAKKGTCSGTEMECIHPSVKFDVTEEWTQVKVPWSDFTPGSNVGNPVEVTGKNIWQLQVDVGLEWLPDAAGEYMPTPSDYEFAIDSVSFY